MTPFAERVPTDCARWEKRTVLQLRSLALGVAATQGGKHDGGTLRDSGSAQDLRAKANSGTGI